MPRFSGSDLTCLRGERVVFSGLAFALEAGGALVLKGPNASGKSSLLRLMAGLLHPLAGCLAWDGAAIAEDLEAHHRRLLYVGHLDAVKPALTVAENLRFWAALGEGRDAAAAVAGALDAFAMAHLAALPARFLSAGQRRRLALARLLTGDAPLWLLDEPSTALDEDATRRLEGALARHRETGGMAVVATHAELAIAEAGVLVLGAGPAARPHPEPRAPLLRPSSG